MFSHKLIILKKNLRFMRWAKNCPKYSKRQRPLRTFTCMVFFKKAKAIASRCSKNGVPLKARFVHFKKHFRWGSASEKNRFSRSVPGSKEKIFLEPEADTQPLFAFFLNTTSKSSRKKLHRHGTKKCAGF